MHEACLRAGLRLVDLRVHVDQRAASTRKRLRGSSNPRSQELAGDGCRRCGGEVRARRKKKRGFGPRVSVNRSVSRLDSPFEDEAALIQTYRQTIRPLYRYVSRRVGGDVGLAEDLVQDTWMRALDSWPKRGVPDEPLAWLIRVARNVLIDYFRRARPEPVDPATIDLEAAASSIAGADTGDRAAVVSWGLARLRRAHAEVLEAFYFDGKSVRDIAREQSTSERAVEGRLRRARAKLKKVLRKIESPGPARSRSAEERTSHGSETRTTR